MLGARWRAEHAPLPPRYARPPTLLPGTTRALQHPEMGETTDTIAEHDLPSPLRVAALSLTTTLLAIAFLTLLVIDQVHAAG